MGPSALGHTLLLAGLLVASAAAAARNATVSVWWKPASLAGLPAEIDELGSALAATDVLVYCGYAALPNGSFGVSPNATQRTWGNVTLCEAAVAAAATAAGLRSRIMVEGRAALGFEAAVRRGGAMFGAEMAMQVRPGHYGAGLRGFNFDFEQKAGTQDRAGPCQRQLEGVRRLSARGRGCASWARGHGRCFDRLSLHG